MICTVSHSLPSAVVHWAMWEILTAGLEFVFVTEVILMLSSGCLQIF